ncbi:MAG TPA: hypothetical protein VGF28_09645 [Thermoanaerobaculia bacterium]|jgi:hypothetical protein
MKALLLALAINWNADLTHLATELPKTHPNPFHKTSREAFLADVERLRSRAPELQPHEVIVEMARIVASLGDGHTRVTLPLAASHGFFQGHATTAPPKDPSLLFTAIPLRFALRNEGLFTTDGRRVLRIGNMSAEEAIAALMPVVHGDNEWQKKEIVAGYLAVPQVLAARGVISSLAEVPVTFEDGTVVFEPSAAGAAAAPQGRPWSFVVRDKAVLFDFDEVANTKEETFAAFVDRLFRFIDEQPVDRLVIDLRDNYGGNNSLNRPLVHALIRAKKLQAPGTVFVLTGRRTFSAAMHLLIDLEQNTNAIFVGEPTGGAPNGYGDSRRIILPESGVTVRVSSLYWQKSDPRDKRDTIEPHLRTETPLETALDYFGAQATKGTWTGFVSIDFQRLPVTIVDGEVTTPDLKEYQFSLRLGAKRAAGTMTVNGLDYLVTAER